MKTVLFGVLVFLFWGNFGVLFSQESADAPDELDAGEGLIDSILQEPSLKQPPAIPQDKPSDKPPDKPGEKADPKNDATGPEQVMGPRPPATLQVTPPTAAKDTMIILDDEFQVTPDKTGTTESSKLVEDEFMAGENLIDDEFKMPKAEKEGLTDEFSAGDDLVADEFGGVALPTPKIEEDIAEGSVLVDSSLQKDDLVGVLFDLEGYLRRQYLPETMDIMRISNYYSGQYFFHSLPHNSRKFQNEFTTRVELTPKLGPTELCITPEFNLDDYGAAKDFDAFRHWEDNGARRSQITLAEAYCKMQCGPVDFSIGKRIYAGGAAFGPNPTDNLNPYDLIDPIEGFNISNDRKIGIWSVYAKVYLAEIFDWELWKTLEFPALTMVFVPRFTKNRAAFPDSRWYVDIAEQLRPLATEIEQQLGFFPGTIHLQRKETMPAHILRNSQWFAKLSSSVHGWDWSLSYYEGISRFPARKLDFSSLPALDIVDFFDNVRTLGMDLVTTFGPVKVFFEGTHSWSASRDQDDIFNIIFGGGRYFTPVLFDADKFDFTLELFFNRLVSRSTDNRDIVGFPQQAGDRGLILYTLYELDQTWNLSMTLALYLNEDYRWASHYYQLRLGYKVHGNLLLALKLQLLNGKREDINYGTYKNNDALSFTIDYTF